MDKRLISCDEPAEKNDLCIFHDVSYLGYDTKDFDSRVNNINKRLKSKIKSTTSSNTWDNPLILFGYTLANVDLSNERIENILFWNSTFLNHSNFSSSTLYNVTFNNSRFNGKCNFTQINFLGSLAFYNGTEFLDSTYFNGTQFDTIHTSFIDTKFRKDVYFNSAKFKSQMTDFSNAEFIGNISDFSNAEFSSTVYNFLSTKFVGKSVLFTHSLFGGETVNFSGAKIKNGKFSRIGFGCRNLLIERVFFFGKITDFSETLFGSRGTYFSDSHFSSNYTLFKRASFIGSPAKVNNEIIDKTYFTNTIFEKITSFENSTIKSVEFKDTVFHGPTFFKQVKFLDSNIEPTSFDTFSMSTVSFIDSDIKNVKFRETIKWWEDNHFGFHGLFDERIISVILDNLSLLEELYSIFGKNESVINNYKNNKKNKTELNTFLMDLLGKFQRGIFVLNKTQIKKDSKGIINSLSITVTNTMKDISNEEFDELNFEFRRVNVHNAQFFVNEQEIAQFHVFDNSKLYIKNPLISDIKSVYRKLRDNYDSESRFQESGRFFIREKELDRLYTQKYKNKNLYVENKNKIVKYIKIKKSRIRKFISFSALYYFISRYGENPWLPLVWIFILVCLTSIWRVFNPNLGPDIFQEFYYSLLTIDIKNLDKITSIAGMQLDESFRMFAYGFDFNYEIWSTAIKDSIINVVPGFNLNPEFKLINFVTSIFGGIFIGNMIIALRRKFERSFKGK